MRRTAVLRDERDRFVGRTTVAEVTFIIKHRDALYVRTEKGVRLPGGGIGVVFDQTEIFVRDKLEPI